MGMDFIGQVPAVQTLNSAIHRINHYPAHDPADKYLGTNYAIHWIDIYPMDSTIHLLNNWGTNLKRGVENDIFWSEIESGFLEPGGTPTTIIPMNTPPPHPGSGHVGHVLSAGYGAPRRLHGGYAATAIWDMD